MVQFLNWSVVHMGADGRGAATIPALALLYVLWVGEYAFELLSRANIHKFNAPWLEDGEIRQMSFT
jgi:hypothetical protein